MLNKLDIAFNFALKKHKGQLRKGTNKPYVIHPINVYYLLKEVTKDEDVLISALLHDTLEDTDTTEQEIKDLFGERVLSIVKEVTKDKNKNFNINSREGLMVKLADTLHNISNSENTRYINKKIKWISEIYEN